MEMSGILDGAGGASCHLCIATKEELIFKYFILHGFPINKNIEVLKEILNEVDEDEFLERAPAARINITHTPASDINIIPASPLHGYLRLFSWLMNLVHHLHAGERKWSPTSPEIDYSRSFVRDFLWEKTGMKIDYPESHDGTSTTWIREYSKRCFSNNVSHAQEIDFLRWVLTLLPVENRDSFATIHLNLAVILRVFNSA